MGLLPNVQYRMMLKAKSSGLVPARVQIKPLQKTNGGVIAREGMQLTATFTEYATDFQVTESVEAKVMVQCGKASAGSTIDIESIDVVALCPETDTDTLPTPSVQNLLSRNR